jgi:hypothetical protein
MHFSLLQNIFGYSDDLLTIVLCVIFWRPSLRKIHGWLFAYLAVKSISTLALEFLLHGPLLASPMAYTKAYFVLWYASLGVCSVLMLMVCLNTYRLALSHLPGLARIGSAVFGWAFVASLLVTVSTFTNVSYASDMFMQFVGQASRSLATIELCLLAFLTVCMQAIDLPVRSKPYGIALGLGIFSLSNWFQSYLISHQVPMTGTLQVLPQAMSLCALAIWLTYTLLPEPARKPLTLPVSSTVYRWNQIASALGHKGTQVAVQPQPSFFLADVEKVVERAFARTAAKETEV